jgi:phenylacetate-coenzyme A ligase PaaK-like adenylate-forming protein
MIWNRPVETAPRSRINPEIAIVPPKTIPRSEGKAVRVVERR